MSPRLTVRKSGTRIIPCDTCKKQPKCAMYLNASRNMFRHQEYSQGTPILTYCNIYVPNRMPGNIKIPHTYPRTSGQDPT